MALHDSARHQLLARRKQLEERVSRIHADLHRRDEPLPADFAEQVVERENLDVLYALEDEGKAEISSIDRALARIANNGYGWCTLCGAAIGEMRLKALPQAEICIDCAG